jgi:hypothetical protein
MVEKVEPETESIRLAMDEAWRDHQHTRDQTWLALKIELAVAAGVVGANWTANSALLGIASGVLMLITALCGVQITLRHRRVEVTKFNHIMNCEEALGLRDLITDVKRPELISFWDAFKPRKGNTARFILRMHVAILLFSLLFIVWRIVQVLSGS